MSIRIYTDGGARGNPGPAACAFVVVDESGEIIYQQGFYLGETTNNQAEYSGVLKALEWLSTQKYDEIEFHLDSQLVVSQLNGVFKIKNKNLIKKVFAIKKLIKNCNLKIKNFIYIPRLQNSTADFLVNQTLNQRS